MDRNRFALTTGQTGLQLMWRGLLLVPLIFLGLFFFYPLLSILRLSFAPDGTPDLTGFIDIATSSYYQNTLFFTIWQALLSTILTLILALPGAYIFARYRFFGKNTLLSLAVLPFVLPTVVVSAAFTALIGPSGLLNELLMTMFELDSPPIQLQRTLALILIVHVFYNYPLALRMLTGFWANQSPRVEEAARVLGANGFKIWWHIRLPLLRPALLATGVLVYIFTFTSFGVILILGGPRFATIEVEIYRQVSGLFNLPVAAALSIVQIAFMFAMMAVYTRLQRQNATDIASAVDTARPPIQSVRNY
jgi:thiamine transport system permease protein